MECSRYLDSPDLLNHLMHQAQTGYTDEYRSIEETFSPEVMAEVTDFIRLH
ncbi:MAG: hypothetical protein HDR94_05060 [Bacteroides sp.]|nr:hypothetical protein [Bacteroides sp.]MBD5340926.1 hypothetical protein [Bacteroides sp.]